MNKTFAVALLFVASAASADAVWLTEMGPNKIQVIKAVREVTALGLKDAKDLVESAPKLVKDGLSKAEADAAVAKLVAAGAKAEVRSADAGTSAAAAPATVAPAGAGFSVKLESFGTSKIMCIKVVRDATGLGLADTKKLVESARSS